MRACVVGDNLAWAVRHYELFRVCGLREGLRVKFYGSGFRFMVEGLGLRV